MGYCMWVQVIALGPTLILTTQGNKWQVDVPILFFIVCCAWYNSFAAVLCSSFHMHTSSQVICTAYQYHCHNRCNVRSPACCANTVYSPCRTSDESGLCNDGIDNDCDGLIDWEDPDCPFLPVSNTPKGLPWTRDASTPHAMNAALLSLLYSLQKDVDVDLARDLQCWSWDKLQYVLGNR